MTLDAQDPPIESLRALDPSLLAFAVFLGEAEAYTAQDVLYALNHPEEEWKLSEAWEEFVAHVEHGGLDL